jgi:hypothetical protein
METPVKVFGKEAKAISPGDVFIPTFESVEGRDVVTLVKNNTLEKMLDMYDAGTIGLDQMIKEIRHITSKENVIA